MEDVYTKGHGAYEYRSDFDILVITKLKKFSEDMPLQQNVEDSIEKTKQIKTDTNIIYHHIEKVNGRLSEGQYFFSDVKKEGILLCDSRNFKLARRRKLNPRERAMIAEDDFKYWSKSAKEFYGYHEDGVRKRQYKPAAFLLHQATPDEERMFKLLVKAYVDARYKPSYRITKKELEYLGARVKKLHGMARRICRKKIGNYFEGAG